MKRVVPIFLVLMAISVFLLPATYAADSTLTKETINKKNWIIDSGGKRIIKDKEIRIDRSMLVTNSSKVVIENSTVVFTTAFKDASWVQLKKDSSLVLKNSTLKAPQGVDTAIFVERNTQLLTKGVKTNLQIVVHGGKVIIDSSQMRIDGVGALLMGADPHSSVKVVDSILGNVSLSFWKMNSQLTLELRPGMIKHKLIELPPPSRAKMELQNTSVGSWDIDTGLWNSNVVLENSLLRMAWLRFPEGSDVKIKGLRSDYFPHLNLKEKVKGEGFNWNLEFYNTTLSRNGPPLTFKLIILGNAIVENSRGIQIRTRPWTAFTEIQVRNSTITARAILTGMNTYFKLVNSTIEDRALILFDKPKRNLKAWLYLKFENSIIDAPIRMAARYAELSGDVEIRTRIDEVQFEPGKTLIRKYPVILKGNQADNFKLVLRDSKGHTVWKEKVTGNKTTQFKIEFDSHNFANKWKLVLIGDSGVRSSQKISLLTDTPVTFDLSALGKEE